MHLRGEAQASPRIVVRRFVPPAISTQDCRQDVSDPGAARENSLTTEGLGPIEMEKAERVRLSSTCAQC